MFRQNRHRPEVQASPSSHAAVLSAFTHVRLHNCHPVQTLSSSQFSLYRHMFRQNRHRPEYRHRRHHMLRCYPRLHTYRLHNCHPYRHCRRHSLSLYRHMFRQNRHRPGTGIAVITCCGVIRVYTRTVYTTVIRTDIVVVTVFRCTGTCSVRTDIVQGTGIAVITCCGVIRVYTRTVYTTVIRTDIVVVTVFRCTGTCSVRTDIVQGTGIAVITCCGVIRVYTRTVYTTVIRTDIVVVTVFAVPAHVPSEQTSFRVQASPSSHAAVLSAFTHVPSTQLSFVQTLSSSQSFAVPAHVPSEQTSSEYRHRRHHMLRCYPRLHTYRLHNCHPYRHCRRHSLSLYRHMFRQNRHRQSTGIAVITCCGVIRVYTRTVYTTVIRTDIVVVTVFRCTGTCSVRTDIVRVQASPSSHAAVLSAFTHVPSTQLSFVQTLSSSQSSLYRHMFHLNRLRSELQASPSSHAAVLSVFTHVPSTQLSFVQTLSSLQSSLYRHMFRQNRLRQSYRHRRHHMLQCYPRLHTYRLHNCHRYRHCRRHSLRCSSTFSISTDFVRVTGIAVIACCSVIRVYTRPSTQLSSVQTLSSSQSSLYRHMFRQHRLRQSYRHRRHHMLRCYPRLHTYVYTTVIGTDIVVVTVFRCTGTCSVRTDIVQSYRHRRHHMERCYPRLHMYRLHNCHLYRHCRRHSLSALPAHVPSEQTSFKYRHRRHHT